MQEQGVAQDDPELLRVKNILVQIQHVKQYNQLQAFARSRAQAQAQAQTQAQPQQEQNG